jgi:very-short-patch-repair endonuclease
MDRHQAGHRSDSFPVLAGEALVGWGNPALERFPFVSWAAARRFQYPDAARPLLCQCQSAAEAYFVREFSTRPGVTIGATENGVAVALCGDVGLELQVAAGAYRVDAVVTKGAFRLAVEIDGLGFHTMKAEQVAADYVRERRIVCRGFTVIRFTAQEVFADSAECWRQIDAILNAHANRIHR